MAEILFLAHRIPYPPDKGDKIRSWHMLKFLAARHRVHLGCFLDDEADRKHAGVFDDLCASRCLVALEPRRARVRALSGFLRAEPLTLPYYRDAALVRWINRLCATRRIDAALAFSSSMAPYLMIEDFARCRRMVDFVDVDSVKWLDYAARKKPPARWLYRREGQRLFAFERQAAGLADVASFVSAEEARLFCRLAPEVSSRVAVLSNGVDSRYFDPSLPAGAMVEIGKSAVVFTGAMDYWPNIEGVSWFAREVWPLLRSDHPDLTFHIVGAKPAPSVRALAELPGIYVTGAVPDVRPFLRAAQAVVCPLRIARGVQNKVLEAMAMAKPVIASPEALTGLDLALGQEALAASSPQDYRAALGTVLAGGRGLEIGRRARQRITRDFTWECALGGFEELLLPVLAEPARSRGVV